MHSLFSSSDDDHHQISPIYSRPKIKNKDLNSIQQARRRRLLSRHSLQTLQKPRRQPDPSRSDELTLARKSTSPGVDGTDNDDEDFLQQQRLLRTNSSELPPMLLSGQQPVSVDGGFDQQKSKQSESPTVLGMKRLLDQNFIQAMMITEQRLISLANKFMMRWIKMRRAGPNDQASSMGRQGAELSLLGYPRNKYLYAVNYYTSS